VTAMHGLLVGDAADRLRRLPIRRLLVTDTVPPGPAPGLSVQVRSVATLLADVIGRLHCEQPLNDLEMRT
jgi:ribose-phosphate pyrophosphokinase